MSQTTRFLAVLGAALLSPAFPVAAVEYHAAPIEPLARSALLLDICYAAGRLVVAGEHGIILYSDDDGKNWQQASVPTSRMLTGVYFADAQNGWAVGHDGLILFSDDGGESWRIQRDGLAVQRQTNIERSRAARRQLAAVQRQLDAAGEDERAECEAALEDAQIDLEDADLAVEEPVFTSPLMDVWFQDTDRGWAVGAFGTFVGTVDGGRHWVNRADELDNPDGFHLNAITGDGRGRVFIAGESGVMFRSMDGGRHWETLEPFYEGSWFGAAYEKKNDSLFIFGLRGNLYRSTDFGTNWQKVPNDSGASLAGGNASPDGKVVIAGGVGTLLFSTDAGASFQRTTLADRLGLTSGLAQDGKLIVTGQGGLRVMEAPRDAR